MKNQVVKEIVIVGGGAAGWISAGVLAAEHQSSSERGIKVTLVESPDIATIGVGEGTWPSMRTTLKKIGLSEADLIQKCDASFKQASKFVDWQVGRGEFYYHPFTLPQQFSENQIHTAWQTHWPQENFADIACAQGTICELGLAPKQAGTPEYAGVLNYGYHIDAGKFSEVLKQHCIEKLGVNYLQDEMLAIESCENGDIKSIKLKNNPDLGGDLFIDCTGLRSKLLAEHFQIDLLDQSHILFNNTALAIQAPYNEESSPIASPTISTAKSAGWIWDIGLSSRRGVGYVYSDQYADEKESEKILRAYIADSIGEEKSMDLPCRKIQFKSGYRKKFWHNNCVAVGMSSGFLEPLEASALAMIELSAAMIRDEMPTTREHMAIVEQRYNQRFHLHWSHAIEFLKLHYVISQRDDSQYWCDNRDEKSFTDGLSDRLQLWQYQAPGKNDFTHSEEMFPAASYQYVLYGMGYNTDKRTTDRTVSELRFANDLREKNERTLSQYKAGLPNNRDLINTIVKHGMRAI